MKVAKFEHIMHQRAHQHDFCQLPQQQPAASGQHADTQGKPISLCN